MVLPAEIHRVDVHASVVCPIIGQGNYKFGPDFRRSIDNLVERLHVDGRRAIGVEPLKDHLGAARSLTTVVGEPIGHVCRVLVVEAPCSEHGEPGLLGGRQALLDVGLRLQCYRQFSKVN